MADKLTLNEDLFEESNEYALICTDESYDPEGLNIPNNAGVIYHIGSIEECEDELDALAAKVKNRGNKISQKTDTFMKVYYPHAIANEYYSVVPYDADKLSNYRKILKSFINEDLFEESYNELFPGATAKETIVYLFEMNNIDNYTIKDELIFFKHPKTLSKAFRLLEKEGFDVYGYNGLQGKALGVEELAYEYVDESLDEELSFSKKQEIQEYVKSALNSLGSAVIEFDAYGDDEELNNKLTDIYRLLLDANTRLFKLKSIKESLEGPQTEEEVGISHLILDAISCVTEMISMYNDITANTSDQEIIEVINQIAEDNNKHMGMLQSILTNVSPNAEAIQDGAEEVAVDEVVTVDPEFIPVEESLDEEVSDTTLIGKVVANDGKELQKVLAKCGYSNVKHEGHYVFSAIKDGKVVYIDTKPLDDENESEKIEIKSISESLNEDLHDKFKKDIKNAYKQWAAEVEKVEQQRKDLKDKFQDVESEEKKKEYEELTDKLFPMPADFKFEFPKNIEKDDFPFYVTYYAEYPIYQPAEGGYYYAGKDAIWSEGVNSEEEAWDYVNDFIDEQEDKTEWEKFSDGYLLRGQYIGEDQSIIIEPRDSYLSAVKGWEPYQ